jgi:hypothetical protein
MDAGEPKRSRRRVDLSPPHCHWISISLVLTPLWSGKYFPKWFPEPHNADPHKVTRFSIVHGFVRNGISIKTLIFNVLLIFAATNRCKEICGDLHRASMAQTRNSSPNSSQKSMVREPIRQIFCVSGYVLFGPKCQISKLLTASPAPKLSIVRSTHPIHPWKFQIFLKVAPASKRKCRESVSFSVRIGFFWARFQGNSIDRTAASGLDQVSWFLHRSKSLRIHGHALIGSPPVPWAKYDQYKMLTWGDRFLESDFQISKYSPK